MIGSDPELFYHNGKKFVSAIGKVGGSKADPMRLLGGFALQEDNVAVEYNTPPTKNLDRWVWGHQLMMEEITLRAAEYGCKPKVVSSANFDEVELSHPNAQVFGCDPDFDAWELEPNPKPQADDKSLRSAGGHIHLGMEADNMTKIAAVRAADLLLGVPLAFLDRESKRRALYGRAGACRFKPYGVEYRTPSNVWLRDEDLLAAVGEIALHLTDTSYARKIGEIANKNEDLIKTAINDLNEKSFLKLSHHLRGSWPSKILKRIKIEEKMEEDEAITLIIEP